MVGCSSHVAIMLDMVVIVIKVVIGKKQHNNIPVT